MLNYIERRRSTTEEDDLNLSNQMYAIVMSLRKKYINESKLPTDPNEAKLDALSYAIAVTNVHGLVDPQRGSESLEPICKAVEGDFSGIKKWLEYHARPDPNTIHQSELNLAKLL